MKYGKFYKLLEKNGWMLKRKSKHYIYEHPEHGILAVPHHPSEEVPKGFERKVRKQYGLS